MKRLLALLLVPVLVFAQTPNRPSRLNVSVPKPSGDGLYHGRYPQGNAPGVLGGHAIVTATGAGTLNVPGGASIKWHPGHYMASDTLLQFNNTGPLTQMEGDIAVANASSGLAGYGIYVLWGAIEQSAGTYDFSQIDTLISRVGVGRHIIIQVGTTVFGGPMSTASVPNYIFSNTATYGSAGGNGAGGVCQGANGGGIAIWRPAVGARWNALLAALGAKYDGNATVEAIGSGDESATGSNVSPGGNFGVSGCDFTEAAYKAAYLSSYGVAKGAMPHTNVIGLGVNFTVGDAGNNPAPASIALIQDEYANTVGTSWPDSPGQPPSVGFLGGPTWGQSALLGQAGSPGFVYASKIPTFADVQDFCTPGCIDYTATPETIAEYGTQTLKDTHMIWDYVGSGGGASGDWTASLPNGILASIQAFPILNTGCPAIYTSGCNPN